MKHNQNKTMAKQQGITLIQAGLFFVLLLLLLLTGCKGQQKTKEQLVNDGVKMLQQDGNPRGAIILFKNALEKDQNYFEARFQLAKAQNAIGNYEAAEKELQKVKRQNPSSRDVQIEMARLKVFTKRPDEALVELSAYLGDDSSDCDALEIAGIAHAVKEDFPVSVLLLKKATAACGFKSISPSLSLASVYISMEKFKDAEVQIAQVMLKEPENKRALYLLAQIQVQTKDRASALKTYDRIIQSNPREIEAYYQKGVQLLEGGEYDSALAHSQAMTKQFPDRAEGHRLQGFAFFFQQKYSDAIAPLQQAILKQPNAGTYYILGMTHFSRNESEQALNQFQKALDLQPTFSRARAHLALIMLNKKRVDDAIKEAKTAISQESDNAFAHNVLGSAYLAKGNYNEGMAELNKALAIDPTLADVHIKKGLAAMRRGKGHEAESELISAVRARPEARDARRILALYYINNNEPLKAVDILKKGIQAGSADEVAYYLLGEANLRQNSLNEAKANFLKAKELNKKYDLAYLKLASIHFMQDKQDLGIQELRNLVEQSPDNVQALLLLASLAELNSDDGEAGKYYLRAAETKKPEGVIAAAKFFNRSKDSDKALKILSDGIAASPTDISLQEIKGQILIGNKKFKEALSAFEMIERHNAQAGFSYMVNTYIAMGDHAKAMEKVRAEIKKYPTNLSLRAELSRVYLAMGKKDEAVDNAREIIRQNSDSPVGYLALALVHQSGKDIDKSIEALKSSKKSGDAAIAVMLGNLYAAKKNYPAALEQYRKAESINPKADQILFQKASILYAMGKKQEAEKDYLKVLRLQPNHAMALNNLAYLYAEENKSKPQALMFATRAFVLAPKNDFIRDTLGFVLIKTGRLDQGTKMLQKAAESSPNNASILFHLAIAYNEKGDPNKAADMLQKAISLGDFPEAKEAKTLLDKIKKNGKT